MSLLDSLNKKIDMTGIVHLDEDDDLVIQRSPQLIMTVMQIIGNLERVNHLLAQLTQAKEGLENSLASCTDNKGTPL